MSRWRRNSGTLPSKVEGLHLDRQAVIYVGQSTLQQLEHNRESTAVQYALVERACLLGWVRPRVTVIDDDLGCSVASAVSRPGFRKRPPSYAASAFPVTSATLLQFQGSSSSMRVIL
jgi:hypothetical protein